MPVVDPDIEAYAARHSTPESPALAALAAETEAGCEDHRMMVGPLEGSLLAMLVFATGARRVLEIGTFTGYSALSMAAALGPDGTIVTCDIDPQTNAIARRHVESTGNAGRIDLRLGPAADTVAGLEGPFDLVFIDADKAGYDGYYEAVLPKLSPRGLIVVDNVLWSGRVLDDSDVTDDTVALRRFNAKVAADPRVQAVMLTVRDGVTLVRRR